MMSCPIMCESANLDKYSEFVTNKVGIFEVIERKSIKFILLFLSSKPAFYVIILSKMMIENVFEGGMYVNPYFVCKSFVLFYEI